ncbi:Lrp/AsnC family leucine-responsive transcriptional regulator [Anaerospora hongkongensis]|uniref:Lrp/AsnC family leucine-responsive transcriptional regulator n=1 Tax=Anaerospora hongkongensis TaxID=244830 RepID=A0A4R1Q3I8_9FIRM|nr:Lrp/AsnC family transcriptional regulator [Anaerospora hongkongensis]TCL38562.1 Lrp/AsnC family leucine-responsive transcriptional regulator [Anaerospora hongkongensis]
MDQKDRKILALLQQNARMTNVEIARQIDLAPSVTLTRIRKLEEQGVIQGYEAKLNPLALGLDMLAFVLVKVIGPTDIEGRLINIPGVQEVHNIAGEDCYLVKVRTRNTEALSRLLKENLREDYISTKTIIVLSVLKETNELMLD